MMKILVFCVLAFFCGTSAETWDSRGLAVDDSLLMQDVWGNAEREQARDTSNNGWVILPVGAVPDIVRCIFPPIEPVDGLEHFNLTGPPYASFDECELYVTQEWEAMKIVDNEEQVAEGKTTFRLGNPELIPIPHCANPTVGLRYASAPPQDLFKFRFPSDCWGIPEILAGIKPSFSGFIVGETKFNLCPDLAENGVSPAGCLQSADIPAFQFNYGIYDSIQDVLAIRRGPATSDKKVWYNEYKTEFSYQKVCEDSQISLPMGSIVSSFSRINSIAQATNGTQVRCKLV